MKASAHSFCSGGKTSCSSMQLESLQQGGESKNAQWHRATAIRAVSCPLDGPQALFIRRSALILNKLTLHGHSGLQGSGVVKESFLAVRDVSCKLHHSFETSICLSEADRACRSPWHTKVRPGSIGIHTKLLGAKRAAVPNSQLGTVHALVTSFHNHELCPLCNVHARGGKGGK